MSEPTVRRRRTVGESNGAEERTRTSTGLLPLAPQASASANSATPAGSEKYRTTTASCCLAAVLPEPPEQVEPGSH